MVETNRISLKKNMYLFAIGVFFTKIINFIFAPIYSYYLSTSEFGVIDILLTTAFLIIPIATLAITEGLLKYGIDDNSDLKKIFSTGLSIDFIGLALMIAVTTVAGQFVYKEYLISVLLYFSFECIFVFLQTFSRAQKKTVHYAISSIIYSLFSSTMILFFIAFKKIGVNGYFYGLSIGVFASIIYLIFACKIWNYFSFKSIDKNIASLMIKYSAPLVISGISYWIISGSDKYITRIVLGENYNGLLSMVHKIPTLCTLLFSIFNYAYVMSALKDHQLSEQTKKEDNIFYSTLFKYITIVLIAGSGLVSMLAYPVTLLYNTDYRSAWVFIPLYSFGVILGAMRNFFSSIYCAKEKTIKIMLVVFVGAIINAASCFLLMKYTNIGLWATAISTILANGFIFLFYYFDSRKYVTLYMGLKEIACLLLCLSIAILPCFLSDFVIYYIVVSAVFLFLLIVNYKEIFIVIKKVLPSRNTIKTK